MRVEDLFCREYVVIGEEANVMHCTNKKKNSLKLRRQEFNSEFNFAEYSLVRSSFGTQ